MAERPPAPAPLPSQPDDPRQERRLLLLGEQQAVRGLTTQDGWRILRAGHVEELMRVIELADSGNVTALAVAIGEAKGLVRTLRLYGRAERPPLDSKSGKKDDSRRPMRGGR